MEGGVRPSLLQKSICDPLYVQGSLILEVVLCKEGPIFGRSRSPRSKLPTSLDRVWGWGFHLKNEKMSRRARPRSRASTLPYSALPGGREEGGGGTSPPRFACFTCWVPCSVKLCYGGRWGDEEEGVGLWRSVEDLSSNAARDDDYEEEDEEDEREWLVRDADGQVFSLSSAMESLRSLRLLLRLRSVKTEKMELQDFSDLSSVRCSFRVYTATSRSARVAEILRHLSSFFVAHGTAENPKLLKSATAAKGKGKEKRTSATSAPSTMLHLLYSSLKAPKFPDDPPSPKAGSFGLAALPTDLVRPISQFMPPGDLRKLGACSKRLLAQSERVYPGLLLALYPHQEAGLAWMQQREKSRAPQPNPVWFKVICSDGNTAWVHGVSGALSFHPPPSIPAVRGGLLCDEPGLGKTITIVALMLRSMGRRTVPIPQPKGPSEAEVEAQFASWGDFREMRMLAMTSDLLSEPEGDIFAHPLTEEGMSAWGAWDYPSIVGPGPYPGICAIRKRVSRYSSLHDFCADVRRIFCNAIAYHGSSSHAKPEPRVASAAARLLEVFNASVKVLWEELVPLDADACRLSSLLPSGTSLVVVPPPMVYHWRDQIALHVEKGFRGRILFDDPLEDRRSLPSAEELASYDVLVTTTSRLSSEDRDWLASPLSQILFLRVIVDEGHSLGQGAWTNAKDAALQIEAECRWVMTGTPAPATTPEAGLAHIKNLLVFLRATGLSENFGEWVRRPYLKGHPAGGERLLSVMQEVMIRHSKADLKFIPQPRKKVECLTMSQKETIAYNCISSFVSSNILLTSTLVGKTSGWQDSLLNASNTKWALQALSNLRLACCGGGMMMPSLTDAHYAETVTMLRRFGAKPIDVSRVQGFLHRACTGELSGCQSCGMPHQILLITPCTHTICTACVDTSPACQCPVCQLPIDVDNFQALQPGFALNFLADPVLASKGAEGAARTGRIANPTVAQPSPRGSDEPEYLHPLARRVSAVDLSVSTVPTWELDLQKIAWEEELDMFTKAKHLLQDLTGIRNAQKEGGVRKDDRPLKCIVFSQFQSALNLMGDQLLKFFGGYPQEGWLERGQESVAEFWGKNKAAELKRFASDTDCVALLLGKAGSHGLDLSFVTHIVLLDQVLDAGLEEQIISRAHRMGARGSVQVVQLLMKDTIEDLLRQMAERKWTSASGSMLPVDRTDYQRKKGVGVLEPAKVHFLLKHVHQSAIAKGKKKEKRPADCPDGPDEGSEPRREKKRAVGFAL
jgi:SNF2 family DNA or RNA helicase